MDVDQRRSALRYKDVIGSITTMGKHIDKEAADILTKIASHVRVLGRFEVSLGANDGSNPILP
jgi:hypothetical protein